jgi:drug/metabolite transporter (DMT)-like permease
MAEDKPKEHIMSYAQIAMGIVCVLMVSVGQVLFKVLGLRLHATPNLFDFKTMGIAAVAFSIYFAASLLWVWLLRTVPLSRAYPFTAATLVLVPLFSVLLLKETVSMSYLLGSALVIAGVALIALNQS